MSTIGGPDNFGLWTNGDFRKGNANEWSLGSYQSTGGPNGNDPYIQITGGGGSGWTGSRIEVDTSAYYKLIVYAKTFSPGSSGNNAGGHIGFACYDKNDTFVDLRNCGGLGNTTLSRDLNPGDTHAYFTDSSGWYTGADVTNNRAYFRWILFYPPSHPDYSTPHEYTRINPVSYYSMVQTAQGDWEVALSSYRGGSTGIQDPTTMPDVGYPLPAGTPVARGAAGGSYNYALGAPTYPTTWTRYSTGLFTGENRNSGTPFRYGTKYVRFLILRNYNRRSESPQDHVWGLSRIFFGKSTDGRDYNNI